MAELILARNLLRDEEGREEVAEKGVYEARSEVKDGCVMGRFVNRFNVEAGEAIDGPAVIVDIVKRMSLHCTADVNIEISQIC